MCVWVEAGLISEALVEVVRHVTSTSVEARFPVKPEQPLRVIERDQVFPITYKGPLRAGRYVICSARSGLGVVAEYVSTTDADANVYALFASLGGLTEAWLPESLFLLARPPIIRSRRRRIITIRRT
jgi:hypothetical protein